MVRSNLPPTQGGAKQAEIKYSNLCHERDIGKDKGRYPVHLDTIEPVHRLIQAPSKDYAATQTVMLKSRHKHSEGSTGIFVKIGCAEPGVSRPLELFSYMTTLLAVTTGNSLLPTQETPEKLRRLQFNQQERLDFIKQMTEISADSPIDSRSRLERILGIYDGISEIPQFINYIGLIIADQKGELVIGKPRASTVTPKIRAGTEFVYIDGGISGRRGGWSRKLHENEQKDLYMLVLEDHATDPVEDHMFLVDAPCKIRSKGIIDGQETEVERDSTLWKEGIYFLYSTTQSNFRIIKSGNLDTVRISQPNIAQLLLEAHSDELEKLVLSMGELSQERVKGYLANVDVNLSKLIETVKEQRKDQMIELIAKKAVAKYKLQKMDDNEVKGYVYVNTEELRAVEGKVGTRFYIGLSPGKGTDMRYVSMLATLLVAQGFCGLTRDHEYLAELTSDKITRATGNGHTQGKGYTTRYQKQ